MSRHGTYDFKYGFIPDEDCPQKTGRVMKDITFCSSTDCPSKDCKIKLLNNKFDPGEIISMADFSGVCRYYIGWLVIELEEGK